MKTNKIDFYFFSGTGNTFLVVKKMKDIFEKNKISVNLHQIEKTDPKNVNLENVIGLGFPVAEQGTYPFVWDFIRSLPKANGTHIFMVDTLLAYSGGVVGPIRKIVKKKGYRPIGAKEIMMPNNLFPRKINLENNEIKIYNGLMKAEKYANDLLEGKSKWYRVPILSDFMAIFSQKEWTWEFFRRYYNLKIDNSKCKKCGQCVKICPVNNILMGDYPELQTRCVFCMRCISFCPVKAIHRGKENYEIYRAINVEELFGFLGNF